MTLEPGDTPRSAFSPPPERRKAPHYWCGAQTADKPVDYRRGLFFWILAFGFIWSRLSCGPWLWCSGHGHGDLLDLLGGCGGQALHLNAPQTSEPGIAMAMKLFGIGKGALHGFLAPLVNGLALWGEPIGIGPFARFLPDMARNGALTLGIGGARGQKRVGLADGKIGAVVPVAAAVGGFIGQR